MLTKTIFTVPSTQFQEAINTIPQIDLRIALNEPTNRFFHDPWKIKSEFQHTVWEQILSGLNSPIGEARLMKIGTEKCYTSHADIDDRWHLSLTGEYCYLVDLDNNALYQTNEMGRWYIMDAGRRHSAVNFGNSERVQLVIRKLLPSPILVNPIPISIISDHNNLNSRYEFDNVISPWLNWASKQNLITNIAVTEYSMQLFIEQDYLDELIKIVNSTNCSKIT
jgi:hypothetical protein